MIRFPRTLIEELHLQLHRILYKEKADHKAGWYDYYFGYFVKELSEIKDKLKEVAKQVNYLQFELEENRIIKEEDGK